MFGAVLAAKMIGIVAVLGGMKVFGTFLGDVAGASPVQDVAKEADDFINPINTMWVLVAAFLVFFMQAGFMALEAGFARSREIRQHPDGVHLRHLPLRGPVLGGRLRLPVRRSATASSGTVLLPERHHRPRTTTAARSTRRSRSWPSSCSSSPSPTPPRPSPRAPWSAAPASRATSSTALCVSGFIYPIFGHWVWGPGGWLGNTMGWFNGIVKDGIVFRDFAGSTVVHTVGGMHRPLRAPSPSGHASAASSSGTAAAPRRRTT